MPDCIFCKLANGQIPCEFLWQDEHVVAFRDLSPQAPVHVLIVPRAHLASTMDLNDAHGPLLVSVTKAAQAIATREGYADKGFRLVTNVGPLGGQSVAHLHYHLLTGRPLAWPPG